MRIAAITALKAKNININKAMIQLPLLKRPIAISNVRIETARTKKARQPMPVRLALSGAVEPLVEETAFIFSRQSAIKITPLYISEKTYVSLYRITAQRLEEQKEGCRLAKDPKLTEIERLLEEVKGKGDTQESGFWKTAKLMMSVWRNSFLVLIAILLLLLVALPLGTWWMIQGSTATESKGAFLEQIQDLNELSTAEAFSKVIIKQEDNTMFGKEIGLDLPGTKRELLVVFPGSVRAGIDFSEITEDDITVNEEAKTATLILPKADFLGGPELFMDQVEIYSNEGLLSGGRDFPESFDLAEEAKELMLEETRGQGVLELAESNAERSVQEMFKLVDYDVSIEFED